MTKFLDILAKCIISLALLGIITGFAFAIVNLFRKDPIAGIVTLGVLIGIPVVLWALIRIVDADYRN